MDDSESSEVGAWRRGLEGDAGAFGEIFDLHKDRVFRHAFRNILVPVLTVVSYSFAYLITGAVLTEAVFSWPGIGTYAVNAARALDFPAVIGVTIVGGVMFLVTNLLTDIAYVLANPRMRLN